MKKYLQKLDTLGLVLLVAAVMWYWVSSTWEAWNLGLAIAGAALVVIGVIANYRQIMDSLGRRSTKYAANYVLSLVLVIAIVTGLNYVGQRHVKRWDTTSGGSFSLAPQTISVLKDLKKDVDIKAFFPGGEHAPLKELLTEYRTVNRHIHFQFIDADKQPDVAKKYNITAYGTYQNILTGAQLKFGTLIVSYDNRDERIEKRSQEVQEEDLTNAIIKAERSETKKVYFIQGHGERTPDDKDRPGLSAAKEKLEDQGYKVETLNLGATGKIPDDAKVLVEAGPSTELFPQELDLIRNYLAKGNIGMLFLIDPPPSPSLESLLKDWGVQADNDLIVFRSNEGQFIGGSVVDTYENHKITENFTLSTIFPLARSIEPMKTLPEGVTVQTLFKSNPESWGETNPNQPLFDPKTDLKGPLSLAVAASREIKSPSDKTPAMNSRIVVVGTSRFPINSYFAMGGNGNLFLNMVSWLAQDEDLISIRPKSPEDRRILLSQSQLLFVRLITVILLPGIALVIGIVVVVNRRRK